MKQLRSQNKAQDRGVKDSIKYQAIKFSIDVHADSYVVTRQIDGATPQPGQKFTLEKLLKWAGKQVLLAQKVYSCYEAGPFGYWLHRRLEAMGIKNVVVRPRKLDVLNGKVKTDSKDALGLLQDLDRYVRGNTKALSVVTVPTLSQEYERAESRHREQLLRHRQQLEAQGRSLMLSHGLRVLGRWWAPKGWETLREQVPAELRPILDTLQELALRMHEKVEAVTAVVESLVEQVPKGVGSLTLEIIRREIKDWNHFKNRRQIASITGLCPGVYASGQTRKLLPITKHGNPRVRHVAVEAAWRLVRFQPAYRAVVKWGSTVRDKTTTAAAKKKAVVAIARHLVIDLWRIYTGRMSPEQAGLCLQKI